MMYDWLASSYREQPAYQILLTWVKQFQSYKASNKIYAIAGEYYQSKWN